MRHRSREKQAENEEQDVFLHTVFVWIYGMTGICTHIRPDSYKLSSAARKICSRIISIMARAKVTQSLHGTRGGSINSSIQRTQKGSRNVSIFQRLRDASACVAAATAMVPFVAYTPCRKLIVCRLIICRLNECKGYSRTMKTVREKRMKLRLLAAKRIRQIREGMGLSQEGLADIAELHRTYVSSVERGERNITVDSLERFADALGVDVRTFFEME